MRKRAPKSKSSNQEAARLSRFSRTFPAAPPPYSAGKVVRSQIFGFGLFLFSAYAGEWKIEGGRLSYEKPGVASMPADGAGPYNSSVLLRVSLGLETVSLRNRPLDLENAALFESAVLHCKMPVHVRPRLIDAEDGGFSARGRYSRHFSEIVFVKVAIASEAACFFCAV